MVGDSTALRQAMVGSRSHQGVGVPQWSAFVPPFAVNTDMARYVEQLLGGVHRGVTCTA